MSIKESLEIAKTKAFEAALKIDVDEVRGSAADMKRKHPDESNEELATRIVRGTRWKCTAVGAVSGLPANLLVSVPAAVVDAGMVFTISLNMAARIATIYDETFLDDEDARYELLIPLFGGQVLSQALRELGVRGGMGVTRAAIKKYISKGLLNAIKRIALRYFGKKITQRAIIAKTLPIVGAAIGGGWNNVEAHIVGKRVIEYFSNIQ